MQPHRSKYRSTIARTRQDMDSIQRLRFVSIGTDLKIRIAFDPRVGREVSSFDNLLGSYGVMLHCGQTLVGTARLALPNPEVARASGTDFGFEIEDEVELGGFRAIRQGLGEIARICVLPAWQSTPAVSRLYEALYCLSRELGVSHWIGCVDARTSRADEADLMFSAIERRGLVDRRLQAGVRAPHRMQTDEDAPGEAFYSERERERAKHATGDIRISKTVATFARRFGARCVGRPVRHPAFPRFVLPMLVALNEFPRETLAKFDLSMLVPSVAPSTLVPPAERMAS
jgi:hypothetical protein